MNETRCHRPTVKHFWKITDKLLKKTYAIKAPYWSRNFFFHRTGWLNPYPANVENMVSSEQFWQMRFNSAFKGLRCSTRGIFWSSPFRILTGNGQFLTILPCHLSVRPGICQHITLNFWRRNYFLNFSTCFIQNVNNRGTKYVRIMKQTAFWRGKNGEYIQYLKCSVHIFVE